MAGPAIRPDCAARRRERARTDGLPRMAHTGEGRSAPPAVYVGEARRSRSGPPRMPIAGEGATPTERWGPRRTTRDRRATLASRPRGDRAERPAHRCGLERGSRSVLWPRVPSQPSGKPFVGFGIRDVRLGDAFQHIREVERSADELDAVHVEEHSGSQVRHALDPVDESPRAAEPGCEGGSLADDVGVGIMRQGPGGASSPTPNRCGRESLRTSARGANGARMERDDLIGGETTRHA
jgi:hypothetical protein